MLQLLEYTLFLIFTRLLLMSLIPYDVILLRCYSRPWTRRKYHPLLFLNSFSPETAVSWAFPPWSAQYGTRSGIPFPESLDGRTERCAHPVSVGKCHTMNPAQVLVAETE